MTSDPPSLEPAGFWIRAAARVVDWFVLGGASLVTATLLLLIAGAVEAATGRPAARMIESMQGTTAIGWVGSMIATLAYHALFEGVTGSTVGKRLLGLQIISMDMTPIRFGQGVKRSLAFLVDALFFGMIAANTMQDSAEKQRVGDKWAGTRVVRRRSLPEGLRPPSLQYVAALLAAVEVACILSIATQLLEYSSYTPAAG